MKKLKTYGKVFLVLVSYLFILLFVYAAVSKLIGLEQFKHQLSRFPYISGYANILAWSVPVLELLIAGLFLFPKHTLTAFGSSLALMIFFTAYIAMVLQFSDDIPCSCGGVLNNMDWKTHLIFNLIFVAMAIMGLWIELKKRKAKHNV